MRKQKSEGILKSSRKSKSEFITMMLMEESNQRGGGEDTFMQSDDGLDEGERGSINQHLDFAHKQ